MTDVTNPLYLTIDEFSTILLRAVKAGRTDSNLAARYHPEDVGIMFSISCDRVQAALESMFELRRDEL